MKTSTLYQEAHERTHDSTSLAPRLPLPLPLAGLCRNISKSHTVQRASGLSRPLVTQVSRSTRRLALITGSLVVLLLAGCEDPYQHTLNPDYTIHVVSTPKGDVAIPPACPSWATDVTDPFDNQITPQIGCAQARNLALSVEQPADLVRGRDLGPQRGVTAIGSIRRYDNDQTRGLIDPQTQADSALATTTSSTGNSTMTGDVTGGGSSSSASPAAAIASSPTGP